MTISQSCRDVSARTDAPQYSDLLMQINDAARGAGEIMLHASMNRSMVMSKEGRANYVTVYDEKVQEYLVGRLGDILPEAHFVGEEEGQEVFLPEYENGYTFVIDPIDGTSNFMKHYGISTTSIGLLRDGQPYIGVIYNPYSGQLFCAEKGAGAFENDVRIRPDDSPLKESLVSMGTAPYYADYITRSSFEIAHWYISRSIDIRRSGSAAWDLCLIASGRIGLFFEPLLCLWDFAAGACIVEEAGGKITDMNGATLTYLGKSSICAVTAGVAKEDYLPPAELLPW